MPNIGLKGRYCIHKVMNPGSILEYRIPLADWFDNVITNTGLNWFCSQSTSSSFAYGHVGSGNTTPTASDIGLVSNLLSEGVVLYSASTGNYGPPNYTKYWRVVHRYNPGIGTGNIAEVGMGTSAKTTPYLFSRALILDSYGTPTTITKLSDETLDITYELQFQYPITDFSGGFSLSGDKAGSYTYTGRSSLISNSPALVTGSVVYCLGFTSQFNAYTGSIGAITSSPSGTVAQKAYTANTYTDGSYVRNYTFNATISELNLSGGILSCQFGNPSGYFQYQFNTAIPKTSSDTLSLNFSIGLSRT